MVAPLLLLVMSVGFPGSVSAAAIERIDVTRDSIVIRLDAPVTDAAVFLLSGPARIAVDVSGATPGGESKVGGPVNAVRMGRTARGTRLVFELSRPAIVTEGSFGKDGRDLTLALRTVDDASFAQATTAGKMSFQAPAPRTVSGDDDSRPLVVIDAGHGGVDPGAISAGDGRREKDVTLRVAKAIRDELRRSGRVRVALTRDDDRFLLLENRYSIARRQKAGLFMSIHADSGPAATTGASAYTLSEVASDKDAARFAARENRADNSAGMNQADPGRDVSSILIDLTQRETLNNSARFARLLGREAQPLIPTKANFHRMAGLTVLKAPDIPSILFKVGYLSNPADVAVIDSADGRQRIAQSVRQAVEAYFARAPVP